jgi:drug/metabolite transporter (DMT)-like permease
MLQQNIRGIYCMILASFFLSLLSNITSVIAGRIPATQLLFISGVIGLLLTTFYNVYHRITFSTKTIIYYVIRSLMACVTFILWFKVLSLIPVTDAIAISYITPLLNMVAAVIFLKEKMTGVRASLSIAGFLGAMLIIKPMIKDLNYGYLLAILVATLWMLNDILAKWQTIHDKPETHLFYLNLFITIFTLPLALLEWSDLSLYGTLDIKLLFALGVVQWLNGLTFLKSYYYANLVVVTPFDFSRLIFTSIFAYYVSGEVVDLTSFIGACIIAFSVSTLAYIEARQSSSVRGTK